MTKFIEQVQNKEEILRDSGLLLGRLGLGLSMAFAHGLGKLQNFSAVTPNFPDPLGVGSSLSLGLAVFAEFACGLLLALGLGTRIVLTQLIAMQRFRYLYTLT